jgi:hypothetical protein
MKHALSLLSLVALLLFGAYDLCAQEPKGAELELMTSVLDVGNIAQDGGKHVVRLGFTNTGDLPLVITEVRTSCSCMTISYERKKVMPSERGVLTISLDPAKAPKGQYLRVVQIFSTATSGVKRVTVKGVIE